MRLGLILFSAGMVAIVTSAQAAEFSIVSGDVHAQAMVTGTPPTTSTPPDVMLTPIVFGGNQTAIAKAAGPDGAVGSFNSNAGVQVNSATFSFAGHATGDGGVAGAPVGTGSGSIDLKFTLDAPTQVLFQGHDTNLTIQGSTTVGTLSSNGNTIAAITFDGTGNLDFTQLLNAGSYELQASDSVGPDGSVGKNLSENVTATIVPEPAAWLGIAGVWALTTLRRRSRANHV
jgi:hypothetical protein